MRRTLVAVLVVAMVSGACKKKPPGGSGSGSGDDPGSSPLPGTGPAPCTEARVPIGGTIRGENHVSWETDERRTQAGMQSVTTYKRHITWHESTTHIGGVGCDEGDDVFPGTDSGNLQCTWHYTFLPEDEGDYFYVTTDQTDEAWDNRYMITIALSEHRYFFHVGGGGAVTCPVAIKGEAIDQDDPRRTEYADLASPGLVHGGELAGTSDKLRVRALTLGSAEKYTWSVTGPDAARYPPPDASSDTWDVGAIAAKPGKLRFHVDVQLVEGGTASADYDVEVGVRTNDVVVIAWIDPTGVTLPASGVSADVKRLLPPSGFGFGDPVGSAAWLGAVASGVLGDNLTAVDRTYVLNWLFKYAANLPPPRSFASEQALAAFVDDPTRYKLLNRFQVKYRTGGLPVFFTPPTILHQTARSGTTVDPILFQRFPGVSNPFVDDRVHLGGASIDHLNEGSPDAQGVKLFNRLMAPTGLTWNDIGSRIRFRIADGGKVTVDMQLYPTYYIYWNQDGGGWVLREQFPQASEPAANFTNPSFPPGESLDLLFRRSDR